MFFLILNFKNAYIKNTTGGQWEGEGEAEGADNGLADGQMGAGLCVLALLGL